MRRLLVVGPLPPPYHGVTISTSLVLANPSLREDFAVEHFDTSDHRTVGNVGTWDPRNVADGLRHAIRLPSKLRGEPGTIYLPISQGVPGLTRDALLIQAASSFGWTIAAHLRGSELADVYRRQGPVTRAWMRRAFDQIDSVAVLGESLRGILEGVVDAARVAVVPNGTPDPGHAEPSDGTLGLYLGNLYRRKGVLEAAQAAMLVLAQVPSARFVFAGGCNDADLAAELDRLGAMSQGRIQRCPPVTGTTKQTLMRSAAYLLFAPVEPEGHPRVVLEAIAAGLPVVTTDRGAIAETVADGESGYVLADPVPEQLARHMIELHTDQGLRRRLSEQARRTYLDRFTQEESDRRLAGWLSSLSS